MVKLFIEVIVLMVIGCVALYVGADKILPCIPAVRKFIQSLENDAESAQLNGRGYRIEETTEDEAVPEKIWVDEWADDYDWRSA